MPKSIRYYILASLVFVMVLALAFVIPSADRAPMLLGVMISLSFAFAKVGRS